MGLLLVGDVHSTGLGRGGPVLQLPGFRHSKPFTINMQKAFQSCASASHRSSMCKPEGWLVVTSSGGVFVEPGQGCSKEDALQRSPASLLFTAAAYVSMAARHNDWLMAASLPTILQLM